MGATSYMIMEKFGLSLKRFLSDFNSLAEFLNSVPVIVNMNVTLNFGGR